MKAKPKQIVSRSDLFEGELVDKPKLALFSTEMDEDGEQKWICPNCAAVIGPDDCDVCGAEPGCLFCNQCNREFEIP